MALLKNYTKIPVFGCRLCNTVASLAKVHGYLSRFVEGVASITAATKCRCGEIITYRIRLRDDKTFSYLDGNRWIDKNPEKSLERRIYGWMKARLFCSFCDGNLIVCGLCQEIAGRIKKTLKSGQHSEEMKG